MKLFRNCLALIIIIFALNGCAHAPKVQMAALTSFTPAMQVSAQWSRDVGGIGKHQYVKLTPVIAGNQIYTASYSGNVTAIDTQTGRKLWQENIKLPITSGLDAAANMVFVGTVKGQIVALNQTNGGIAWWAPVTNEVLAAPVATNNYVLVKSVDDHVFALNTQTGKTVWSYDEPTPDLILRAGSSPQPAGGFAVAGFANGQLGVFNLNNGQIVWKQPIAQPGGISVVERMVDIDDNLVIVGNTIYMATYQGVIAVINLQSGRTLWQHDISSYAGLTVDTRNVYVADADSHVWAFDRQTGKVVWEQDNLFGRKITGPALSNGAVVVADGLGYVHWLSTVDGRFIARARVDNSGVIATPVVSGNSVYIYSNAGRLVKFVVS